MKIQKLVYYAFAWFLAFNRGEPLFDEDIYAWPWGPVVPSIYSEFHAYGRQPIAPERRATQLIPGKRWEISHSDPTAPAAKRAGISPKGVEWP